MSLDIKSTILSKRYKATVQAGKQRYQMPISDLGIYSQYHLDSPINSIEYLTTTSVQVDMHPADFNRLVDTLDYLHGEWPDTAKTASNQMNNDYKPETVHDKFIHHVYQKQFQEEALREQHPLLQDLWNQYKTTLNLLASGNMGNNE